MSTSRCRRAFTVVELLVVVTILAALFGLVISSIRRSDGSVRGAAQQFAAALRNAQGRALGNAAGAAVIIEADADLRVKVSDSNPQAFVEGSVSGMPPPTNGDVYPTSAQITVNPRNAGNDELKYGYKVRFFRGSANQRGQSVSDWFAFSSTNPPSATVSFQTASGQTSRNAFWPSASGLNCCVARYPRRGGVAMTFPKVATIDLRYSGTGSEPGSTWGSLDGKGAIGVSFDVAGSVEALMQQVPVSTVLPAANTPIEPCEPIYFFIVDRAELLKQDRRLAAENAFWVVVHHQTGQVNVAANVPQDGVDAAALLAARANARKVVRIGN